jgi:hypothetical protein
MKWQTGLSHQTDISPDVTVSGDVVKIYLRGLGVYLSMSEAARLGAELTAATTPSEPVERSTPAEVTEEWLGEFIWRTSHADEGTISVMGANIIARGLLALAAVTPRTETETDRDPGLTYVVCDRLLDPETNEHCEFDGDVKLDAKRHWVCPGCKRRSYAPAETETETER